MPYRLLLCLSLLVGCGGASIARSAETLTFIEGVATPVDGRDVSLVGFTPPASVGLSSDYGEVLVGAPGCTRVGGWVWTLTSLDVTATPAIARLVRTRVPADAAPRAFRFGEPIVTSPGEALVGSDGVEITMTRIEVFAPGVWGLHVRATQGDERTVAVLDVQRENAYAQALSHRYTVVPSSTAETDAYGCPRVRLVIDSPAAHVLPVREGEVVELASQESAELEGTRFRYTGWGEAHPASEDGTGRGSSVAFAGIEARDVNDEVIAAAFCHVGEDCEVAGFVVRVEQAEHRSARVRISRGR